VLHLCDASLDHADVVRLNAELQEEYRVRYGGEDTTPTDPRQFDAPHGRFVVGYVDGTAVACGGWRARDGGEDPELRLGDAEIKRMYVAAAHRGRGYARAVLAELERTASAAGRRRAVLESGTRQPEAVALYLSAGYEPMPAFGRYRDSPNSLFFAKPLTASTGRAMGQPTGQAMGQSTGQAMGQSTGQPMGPTTGQAMGPTTTGGRSSMTTEG
jgi:GNAT superfamily N-acetyltransferase